MIMINDNDHDNANNDNNVNDTNNYTIASRIPAARLEGSPFAAQGILIF